MEANYRTRLRSNLRDIAVTLLNEQGLGAIQARRVAELADCAVGTIYNIFGNLDGLIIAANERSLDDLGAVLREARDTAPAGHAEHALMAMAMAYLQFAVEREPTWRAIFEHRLANGGTVPPSYQERRDELFGLVEAVFAGAIRDEAQRHRVARTLFAAVHGIVTLGLDHKLGVFDRAEAEAQVRLVVQVMARALIADRVNTRSEEHAACN